MSMLHMMIDVRGMLRRKDRDLAGMFRAADGRKLRGEEVRELVYDELAKGHHVIPACNAKDCPDFDYSGGGCPGHERVDQTPNTRHVSAHSSMAEHDTSTVGAAGSSPAERSTFPITTCGGNAPSRKPR